jgi:hypothetical protein
MKKLFYFALTAIVLTGCGAPSKKEISKENKKPNILLLVGDDTAFGDI